MKKPTFKIILHGTPNRDGTRTVTLRITYNRNSRFISLNEKATADQWDDEANRFRRNYPNYKDKNDLLVRMLSRAHEVRSKLERDNLPFTFDRFETDFKKESSGQTLTVSAYGHLVAEEKKKLKTRDSYHYTSRAITRVRPNATLADVDGAFLRSLETSWAKDGMKEGGLGVNFRNLRAICNQAIRNGLMQKEWYPFVDFTMPKTKNKGSKKALTLDQFRVFEAIKLPDGDRLAFAHDMFVFSFYARGINLADIAELRETNLQDGIIVYHREKTDKEYRFRISEKTKAKEIFDRYRNNASPYIFPIYSERHVTPVQKKHRLTRVSKDINRKIRVLASGVGISTKDFSFYSARHTYATALKHKDVPIEVIKEALGHTDLRTTEGYLKRFDGTVLDAADKLLD